MIEIRNEWPDNREHFAKLLAFACEILATCHSLGIRPVLTGSLAVFAYTRNQALPVNDIDLACSELEFPKLSHTLGTQGVRCVLKEWHVLQLHYKGSKVEFDAVEYWLTGLSNDYDRLLIDGVEFTLISLSGLQELYRRGLEATAVKDDAMHQAKHMALAAKYAALCTMQS